MGNAVEDVFDFATKTLNGPIMRAASLSVTATIGNVFFVDNYY